MTNSIANKQAKTAAKGRPGSRVRKPGVGVPQGHNSEVSKPDAALKEIKRLRATVAKLTASTSGGTVKQIYLDEVQLATRWGMSVKHIRTLRYAGVGPKVTYFGRSVRYRIRHIVSFEASNAFTSRSDMEVQKQQRK